MCTWLSVCAWVCTCHQNLCGQVPKVGNPDRTVGVLLFSTKQKAANRVVTFVMAEKNSRPHVRQWIDSVMSQCWIRNVSDPLTSAYFCEKSYFLKWCASFTPTAFSHKTSTANQQPAQIAVDSEADPPSSRQIRLTHFGCAHKIWPAHRRHTVKQRTHCRSAHWKRIFSNASSNF